MLSSKVTTTGLYLDDIQPSSTTAGTGWVIGDGITLTAGHIVYEYNRSQTSPNIVDGSNTVFLDFEGYRSAYLTAVQTRIASGSLTSAVTNGEIEATIIARDSVAIRQGGNVDKDNAGLAWFMNSSDLVSSSLILNSLTMTRYGNTTGNIQGSVSSVTANGLFRFSPGSDVGDSGGAYVIVNTITGKGFVFGSQSAQPAPGGVVDPGQPAYATYLSAADFVALSNALEAEQSAGNVTTDEPTNLIVGTGSADTATGTYRADIMLGRGSGDKLNDGDLATDTLYANDLLFGGGGDDTLVAGKGSDLLHGGDSRDYSGAGELNTIENDGNDIVDYSTIIARGSDKKGLTILVAPAGTAGAPAWTYGDTTDQAKAIYVVDQTATTDADHIGSDTLVSIENLSATDADDTLRLDVTAGQAAQFAGSDGKGGLYKIDLKGNAEGVGKGDLIDASKSNINWKIDLSASSNNVVDTNNTSTTVFSVLNAERVKTADGADEIIGSDANNEIQTGKGEDKITGGKGDDTIDGGENEDTAFFSGDCHDYDFLVSGSGASRTVKVVHSRGDKVDGTDTLTNVEWAEFANGERVDLTVENPGCKGQDIAFVIDTTGSMWDDLASVQASATSLINALFDPARGYADSRVAVVAFNDPATNVVLGFTDQEDIAARKSAALAAINSLSADGGGDFPELTFTGLLKALDGSIGEWREDAVSRKIVLFGDATAKDSGLASQVYALAANVNADIGGAAAAAAAVPGLTMMTLNMMETNAETGEMHVVPVQIYTVAIGGYWETVAEFNQIAANTGGLAFQAGTAGDLVEALLKVINLPIYNIRISEDSVEEGDAGSQTLTVTITRDNADQAATVALGRFGTADSADVTGLPGAVEFAVGERYKIFEITVVGDERAEFNEVFGISLASISQNASFTNRTASLTITDDDGPPATIVLDDVTLDFVDEAHFPFISYREDGGDAVLVHQIPYKQIADPDGQLPFSITAIDSADAKHSEADIAVMTTQGLAILDGDDVTGNGRRQGIDDDEQLVIEIDEDAGFDFATGAVIRLSAIDGASTAAQVLLFLDGTQVGSAVADAAGWITLDTLGMGFDKIVLSPLAGASFNVDRIDFTGLYAIEETAGLFAHMGPSDMLI